MNQNPTLQQINESRPYRPAGPREVHADDAQRLLARLRAAGSAGVTTGELIREGCCGLRPPNRCLDLRKAGHLLRTIRESHGVFRYVLVWENPSPIARARAKKAKQTPLPQSEDWFTNSTGQPRAKTPGSTPGPLFDSRVRS
jgi:hypothetical protein